MFDLTQARSFLTVAETRSFSIAAAHLGVSQSTISQHIRKLEEQLGSRLLERDTRRVDLTREGEQFLPDARQMLEIAARVDNRFRKERIRGRLRFGVSEDLVAERLPTILDRFARVYPEIELELTIALSATLFEMQEKGEIDLVFAKRRPGGTHGTLVQRDRLVWLGRDNAVVEEGKLLALISFPPPSLTRSIMLEALEKHGIQWRISCTCASLSGLTAAVRAGLGIMVQPASLVPEGCKILQSDLLPPLENVEFVLVAHKRADRALVDALSQEISWAMDITARVARS